MIQNYSNLLIIIIIIKSFLPEGFWHKNFAYFLIYTIGARENQLVFTKLVFTVWLQSLLNFLKCNDYDFIEQVVRNLLFFQLQTQFSCRFDTKFYVYELSTKNIQPEYKSFLLLEFLLVQIQNLNQIFWKIK